MAISIGIFNIGVARSVCITSLHGDIRKDLEKIVGFHEWQAVRTNRTYALSTKFLFLADGTHGV